MGENVEVLKKIKFGDLEDIYLYLNDKDNIQGIVNHFEEKGINFNFISCDDDNDIDLGDEDFTNKNSNNKNDALGGFKDLLDNDLI